LSSSWIASLAARYDVGGVKRVDSWPDRKVLGQRDGSMAGPAEKAGHRPARCRPVGLVQKPGQGLPDPH